MNKKYNVGDTVYIKGRISGTTLNNKYWIELDDETDETALIEEANITDISAIQQDEVWDFLIRVYTDHTKENEWWGSYNESMTDRYPSYEEAKKAFEKWKTQTSYPKVGDVYTSKDNPNIRFIVIRVSGDNVCRLWVNGNVNEICWDDYKISRKYNYSHHKELLSDLFKEE